MDASGISMSIHMTQSLNHREQLLCYQSCQNALNSVTKVCFISGLPAYRIIWLKMFLEFHGPVTYLINIQHSYTNRGS